LQFNFNKICYSPDPVQSKSSPMLISDRNMQKIVMASLTEMSTIGCQAKFLTSRHARMHRVIFYTSNTLRKLMITA